MKIYTKTGDRGETGLLGGPRVRKDALRIEALGTVDELNALLGVVRSGDLPREIDIPLARVQNELFDLGAELATAEGKAGTRIEPGHVARLEADIDAHEQSLAPLVDFILPGSSRWAAELHLARAVCRRAERGLVRLSAQEAVSQRLIEYLNRLGDLLFVLARAANRAAGKPDLTWRDSR